MPAALLLLLLFALQGCGQKGPLTLPPVDNAASGVRR
jgi:predicted small lipoprotein YifL